MPTRPARLVLLAAVVAVAAIASVAVGAVRIPLGDVWRSLVSPGEVDPTTALIVRDLRLPRAVLAVVVGAGLAASGAAYQGLFRNPLADPFVIGSASGAAVGATVVIIFSPAQTFLGQSGVPAGAFVGALLATGCVYLFATVGGRGSVVQLLLAGAAVSSFLSAVVWMLLSFNDQSTMQVLAWLMGSIAGRGWGGVTSALPYCALGVALLVVLSRPLDALTLGEETARGLGLPVRTATGAVVAAASLATAGAVAAGGIIGFVGLIAPHVARRLVGPRHAALVPASALVGGLLLLTADVAARTLRAPTEMPVGILTALVGGPFFLLIMVKTPKP
jgi:iron complex transport system permease protein